MIQSNFREMTCLERAKFFHNLKGDYKAVLNSDVKGFSRRQIERYTAIWKGLSKPTRDTIASTPIADNQSALTVLSQSSRDRQKKLVGLIFPTSGEPKAKNITEAEFILQHGRLLTDVERKHRQLTKFTEALSPFQLETIFDFHEVEIHAWIKKKAKIKRE